MSTKLVDKYKLPKLVSIASYKTEYRKWSMKRRGACFIFPVMNAALIRERRLFQLQVKHWGEDREKYVRHVLRMRNLI